MGAVIYRAKGKFFISVLGGVAMVHGLQLLLAILIKFGGVPLHGV